MKRSVFATLLVAVCLHAGAVSSKDAHEPTPVPDRVILTWASDPSTSMSVTWRTDTSVDDARAEIAVAEDGPKFTDHTEKIPATSAEFKSDLGEAKMHTVRFTGLKPGTTYVYRVGDGSNWTEWNQFRTASAKEEPLTFLYSGDAQTDIYSHWSRVIREGFRLAPDAQFIVHAGDLVNRGKEDKLWGEWFRAGGWINATIPSLPSPGNHEYASDAVTPHWRAQFDLPENGPAGLEETCYYVDIQGVRIISLNSNERLEEQARWLDEILSNNKSRWTVVTFHHPFFSAAKSRNNERVRDSWQPVFDKYKVDLVLQGHDHTYGRSGLMTGVNSSPDKAGTMYVVSVAGPKMYNLDKESWMKSSAQDTQLIQIIRVDGDRLRFEARTPTGRLHDSFELRKRAGMANLLQDQPVMAGTDAPGPGRTISGGH